MVSYGVALLGLIVSGTLYLHVSRIKSFFPDLLFSNDDLSLPGRREIRLRPNPRKLAPPSSEHRCPLGHLARQHNDPRRTGIYSRLCDPHLQLSNCTGGVSMFRTPCNESPRLALAV